MDQLLRLISGLSTRQKISIVVGALVTGASIYAFVRWKHENDFRPLYTAMAAEDAAGVVQKLRETGVDYRLADNGGSVLVPSTKMAESRLALAAAGLPKTGRIGFELFDQNSFGATEFVEHINYKRALEGELERSIMSLAEVEQSRVHLTLPKESIFLDKQEPAKASVMVKLRPGARIAPQYIVAITNLVAGAVEGLSADSVSIVDTNGTLLSRLRKSGEGAAFTTETLEFRQQIERDLVAKIHTTLEPLLGPDRFRAGASVECDLTSGDQQEETFDPTHSVMVSSQKTEDVSERAKASAGIPGTTSSLPSGSSPILTASGPGGLSRRTESVTFQTSRVVRQTHIPQGVIRRMSLSVLVDNIIRWEGEGAGRRRMLEPQPAETIKTIKDLVAAATGLDASRGDQLIVESLPFESSLSAEPPPGASPKVSSKPESPEPIWLQFLKKNRDLILQLSAALCAILLVIGTALRLLLSRKTKPRPVAAPEFPGPSPAAGTLELAGGLSGNLPARVHGGSDPAALDEARSMELADRVRQLARSDLALATNVIRLWLHETENKPI